MSRRTKVAKYVCEKVASHTSPISVRWMVRHLTYWFGLSAAEANLTVTSLVDHGSLQLDTHPFRGHVLSPPQKGQELERAKKAFFVPDREWDDAFLDPLIVDWPYSDSELEALLVMMLKVGSERKRCDVLAAFLDYGLQFHEEDVAVMLASWLESDNSILASSSAFALMAAVSVPGGPKYLREVIAKGGPNTRLLESALHRGGI